MEVTDIKCCFSVPVSLKERNTIELEYYKRSFDIRANVYSAKWHLYLNCVLESVLSHTKAK